MIDSSDIEEDSKRPVHREEIELHHLGATHSDDNEEDDNLLSNNNEQNEEENKNNWGKSSGEANKQLIDLISAEVNEFNRKYYYSIPKQILSNALQINNLLMLYVIIVFFISYGYLEELSHLIEAILVIIIYLLNISTAIWTNYLLHTEYIGLLRSRISNVLDLPSLSQRATREMPPSSTFVRVYRDFIWRILPMNLLVEGDLIELDAEDELPCKATALEQLVVASATTVMPLFAFPENWQQNKQNHSQANNNQPRNSGRSQDNAADDAGNLNISEIKPPSNTSAAPDLSNSLNTADVAPLNVTANSSTLANTVVRSNSSQTLTELRRNRGDLPSTTRHFVTPAPNTKLFTSISSNNLQALFKQHQQQHLQSQNQQNAANFGGNIAAPSNFVPHFGPNNSNSVQIDPNQPNLVPPPPSPPQIPAPPAPVNSVLSESSPALSSSIVPQNVEKIFDSEGKSSEKLHIQPEITLSTAINGAEEGLQQSLPESLIGNENVKQYLVLESPLKAQLQYILRPREHSQQDRPPINSFLARLYAARTLLTRSTLIFLAIYYIITVIRLSLLRSWPSGAANLAQRAWFYGLFYQSGTLLLPTLLLSCEFLLFFLDSAGNSLLLCTLEAVQRRTEAGEGPSSAFHIQLKRDTAPERLKSKRNSLSTTSLSTENSESWLEAPADADINDCDTFEFIDSLKISARDVLSHLRRIVTGQENYITRTVNLLQVLGSVTVLCCLDNEGILSENEPSADHILFLDGNSKPVVLDLINDPSSTNGIVIEGGGNAWKNHLNSLKPIGLNCILNNSCNMSPVMLCQYEFSGQSASNSISNNLSEMQTCLCPLGKELGFDVAFIRKQYYVSKAIYLVNLNSTRPLKPKRRRKKNEKQIQGEIHGKSGHNFTENTCTDVRMMTSIAIQDRFQPQSVQFLSSGDVELILGNCCDYWDGAQLQSLPESVKQQLNGIFQQWNNQDLHCVAFAYSPILLQHAHYFLDKQHPVSYLIQNNTQFTENYGQMEKPRISRLSLRQNAPNSIDLAPNNAVTVEIGTEKGLLAPELGRSASEEDHLDVIIDQNATAHTVIDIPEHLAGPGEGILENSEESKEDSSNSVSSSMSLTPFAGQRGLNSATLKPVRIFTQPPSPKTSTADLAAPEANSPKNGNPSIETQLDNMKITVHPPSPALSKANPSSKEEVLTLPPPPPPQPAIPAPPPTENHSQRPQIDAVNGNNLGESQSVPSTAQHPLYRGLHNQSNRDKASISVDLGEFSADASDFRLNKGPNHSTFADNQANYGPSAARAPNEDTLGSPTPVMRHLSSELREISSEGEFYNDISRDQIFLGMLAMRDQPKIEVRSLVEHLMNSGIRFVYFSADNERKTQAFGSKIGLFTDFNVWISMKEEGEKRHGNSKLPCGVSAIRSHLSSVDNVPLLVSLFTDCTPNSAQEMIRIYQENGETVLCMGSSLKVSNTQSFMQADVAASLDPIPSRDCEFRTFPGENCTNSSGNCSCSAHAANNSGGNGEIPADSSYSDAREFAASANLTSLPCALPLSETTDLNQFIPLIAEGRRLLKSLVSALWLCSALNFTLFFIYFLCAVANSPAIFTGYQLIWLGAVIIPLLSGSLAFCSPRESDSMIRLAEKNTEPLKDKWRFVAYFAARFGPTIIIYPLLYNWLLYESFNDRIDLIKNSGYFWHDSANSLQFLSSDFRALQLTVQNYCLVVLVFMFCVLSSGFISRHWSIRALNPLRNRVWAVCCVVAMSLQIIFCVASIYSYSSAVPRVDLHDFYWFVFLPWPFVSLAVDELCKGHDRKKRDFYHRKTRQHFDTVLGMHSPK
jgi:magnesium-transporting ATPase (P-type)